MTQALSPRRLAVAIALALSALAAAHAQTPDAKGAASLTVTVDGVRSDGGRVTGSLCNDPKTPFCSTYVARTKAVAGRNELKFEGVAPGRYALSTVHDEDGDGRTEIPPEGFGFGNNSPAPTFDASSIEVAGATKTAVVMTYPGSHRQGSKGVEPPEGIVRIDVRGGGLYGELYAPRNTTGRLPAIVLIDGSSPGLDGVSVIASMMAREGFAALALAYFGEVGLPATLEGVPLEYFDAAVAALKARADVDGERIGAFGVSRGAEAAFLLASRNPAVRAVVGVGPSGVIWRGYDANDPQNTEAAWTVGGRALPFMEVDASLYDPNGPMTPLFASALAKSDAQPKPGTIIPVEKINGPVLLMSGQKDEIWPSAYMAQRIEAQLLKAGFPHDVENIVYAGAGHSFLVTTPDAMTRVLSFFSRTLKD